MSSRVSDKEKEKINHRDTTFIEISNEELNRGFLDFLKNGIDTIPENYMTIIKKIHLILADCPELSSQQKLNFCDIERYFIKLYLKESISGKYSK